jgi:amino acid adenylation domain-containing protein
VSKFDITLAGIETQEGLSFTWEYSTRLFKKETMQRFIHYFKNTISAVLADKTGGVKISDLGIISKEEKQYILYDFNDTEADFPLEKTLHQLFEEQAGRTPDHIALVGKNSRQEGTRELAPLFDLVSISYRELNKKSNQLACLLRDKGVQADTIVAIMVERSIEMIIGILGILKSGGAYLPIDVEYPEDRIKYMLADSSAGIMLTSPDLSGKITFVKEILHLTDAINRVPTPHLHLSPAPVTSLAYIIYTSGSTGGPKGVMIRHQAVVNYICWAAGAYVKCESLDFPLYSSLSFDLTVTSLFTPLVTGNRLYIYSGDHKELLLEKVVEENKVGIIKLTPSHLKLIRVKKIKRSGIKRLIVGGEELETPLADDIFENFNQRVEIYNEYGPTEAAVGCMIHRYNPGRDNRPSVPIGVPASNTRVYILDNYLNPVPHGVIGQLYISGRGLARGYLNNPELTAEKFVLAHSSWLIADREKIKRAVKFPMSYQLSAISYIYKTGDLARFLSNGLIEFVGRVDQQVKLRGFRIEPGEIESHLVKYKNIKEAIVMVGQEKNNEKFLCAYIVSSEKINPGELKRKLAGHLPDPMIPSYMMQLEKMPLTSSGKVNRRKLPAPEITPIVSYIPPVNESEKILIEIWSEILDINQDIIGTSDNFFDLGGHSLKAVRLAFMINTRLGVRIPLIEIFKNSTIKELAEYIAASHDAAGSPGDNKTNQKFFQKESPPGRRRQTDTNLVLLRQTTCSDRNLFLVHDGTGTVEGYIEFCRHLDNAFNCWGIQANRAKGFAWRHITIEDIAGAYIKKVQMLQPGGPYFIAGWSIGGTIAFEMVKQWEQSGAAIGFLGLIDSLPPDKKTAIRVGPFTPKSQLNRMDPTLIRARDVYVPVGKIKTILHYFKASQSIGTNHEKWNNYCRGEQKFYPVKGDHFSILEKPGVSRFATIFDRAIAEVNEI